MVEFKSKLNSKVAKDMSNWQLKRLSPVMIIFSLLIALIGLLSIASGYEDTFASGIVLVVIGVLFVPFVYLLAYIAQKSANKSMSALSDETEQVFQFYEDRFVLIQTKGEDFNERLESKYNLFFKVYEEKTFYIFYISKTQAYLVYKEAITEGTFGELNSILEKNLKDKFKKRKK